MSKRNLHKLMALLIIAVCAIAYPQLAQAAGTVPDTPVTNSVTVDYQVGGAPQAQATASVEFRVDELVTFTVTSNTNVAAVPTSPLASNTAALKFTITNNGNLAHDFGLLETLLAGNSFTPTSVTFYEDDGDGTFEPVGPGGDCPETTGCTYLKQSGGEAYLDELPVDTSVVIFLAIVVSDATDAQNNDTANYSLTVEARQGGSSGNRGTVTSAEAFADPARTKAANLLNVLIVLGESGSSGIEAAYNGIMVRDSAFGFVINAVTLTAAKTMTVISDPVNAGVNPKAIPGAIVEYTITVTYTAGSGTATNVVVNDDVPAGVTMQTDVYGGTGEVERVTVTNGAGSVTTNLNDGDAGLTWGDPLAVQCGADLVIVNDYCRIKYRIAIP